MIYCRKKPVKGSLSSLSCASRSDRSVYTAKKFCERKNNLRFIKCWETLMRQINSNKIILIVCELPSFLKYSSSLAAIQRCKNCRDCLRRWNMIIESGNRSGLLQSHRESSKKNQINGVYTRIRWSKIEFQLFRITLGRGNFSPTSTRERHKISNLRKSIGHI